MKAIAFFVITLFSTSFFVQLISTGLQPKMRIDTPKSTKFFILGNDSENREDKDGYDLKQQFDSKTTSLLWGENGELWDSRGRLPYFAYAGYDAGNSSIPVYTDTINVLDYGATINDTISDVNSILAAISAAPAKSVIFFPAGKYVIDKELKITKSQIVLVGEGNDSTGTVFYLPNSATDVNGQFEGSYASGDYGHFIHFYGGYTSQITKIAEEAIRGDHVIVVESSNELHVGDVIVINAQGDNPTNGELWQEYHNNQSYDWQCSYTWADGNGGSMFHTITKIDGNMVTLQEPLRLKLKPTWDMYVGRLTPGLRNVGIENILIDFIKMPHASHLEEPGYNAISFVSTINFWCKKITINHCDNGIYIKSSTYGNIEDISFTGREGHHALKIAYCANNLISDIKFKTYLPYTHTTTFIHKANGNVVRNISGDNNISLDFHRNAPFSNLICDVRSEWNHASSGAGCAGPHGGARNIYWGLFGQAKPIKWGSEDWGILQNTIVSELSMNEKFSEEREWYENVPNLAERDLYEAQRRYRFSYVPDSIFAENEFGNRNNWSERDFSRWKVQEMDGEKFYALNVKELPKVSQGRVSEYSVIEFPETDTFEISVEAKCFDGHNARKESDLVLITSFFSDDNYIFARISSKDYKTGIFEVKNGRTYNLAKGSHVLNPDENMMLKLSAEGTKITFIANDNLIALAENVENLRFGKSGIGSSKNGIYFDNFVVSDTVSDYPTSTIDVDYDQKNTKVYPNPVKDKLYINTKLENIYYSVLNTNAKVLLRGHGKIIDFSNIISGEYIVIIEMPDKSLKSFKILKAVR